MAGFYQNKLHTVTPGRNALQHLKAVCAVHKFFYLFFFIAFAVQHVNGDAFHKLAPSSNMDHAISFKEKAMYGIGTRAIIEFLSSFSSPINNEIPLWFPRLPC